MLMDTGRFTGFDLQRAALAVTGITGPEKSVLLVLAMMADGSAQAWPPIGGQTGLTTKCCLGERTVQRAIQALCEAGHIERDEKLGRGVVYTVHPRHTGTPASDAPRQSGTPATQAATPATQAPKQPVTTNTSEAKASSVARAPRKPASQYHRLPEGWEPTRPLPPTTAAKVGEWPPGKLKDELAALHRWAVNADNKQGKGRKLDWDAAWANWLEKAHADWSSRRGNRPSDDRRNEIQKPLLRASIADEHQHRSGEGGEGSGASALWP